MTESEIHQKIVLLVTGMIGAAEVEGSADDLLLLGDEGVFDSVTAFELVLAIEREFGIVIADDEVKPENLNSVKSITKFVQSALSSRLP
jgi:acyl carrier protein